MSFKKLSNSVYLCFDKKTSIDQATSIQLGMDIFGGLLGTKIHNLRCKEFLLLKTQNCFYFP